jgi:adenylate cyclase
VWPRIGRQRTNDGGAKLTLTTSGIGVQQAVSECDIPLADADALLKRCEQPIDEMMRHLAIIDGFTWKVDVYRGARIGDVTAQLEVIDPETWPDPLPTWIGAQLP